MTVQERNDEIVRLYVDEKLTISAIAERMGVPIGTVSGRLSQARKRGEVPYRRQAAARYAFGRKRVRQAKHLASKPMANNGVAPTATDIADSIDGRIAALEAELSQLRALRTALKG